MTPKKSITVLLAEDHAVVRQGLCALLETDGHFKIVGEARNGREAVTLARSLRPDVILMDIAMPVLNGLEATQKILAANPAARILILSAHSDDEYIKRARAVGVAGFLEKQTSAEILAKAIREVAAGRACFSPSIAQRLSDPAGELRNAPSAPQHRRERLSARESDVLERVSKGSANKQIAAMLRISVKTVQKHRQSLMDKLGIHDIAGLTRYAVGVGIDQSEVELTIV